MDLKVHLLPIGSGSLRLAIIITDKQTGQQKKILDKQMFGSENIIKNSTNQFKYFWKRESISEKQNKVNDGGF